MAKVTKNEANQREQSDRRYRYKLAIWIIFFVFASILIITIAPLLIAILNRGEESFNQAKDISGMLLPVLGAWAGAVIAYYFGRESFEAGTNSSLALAKQLTPEEKLKSTPISAVMIRIERAVTYTLKKPLDQVRLKSDLIDSLEVHNQERLPIFDSQGCIKYMAHRSLIDKFIVQEISSSNINVKELSLQNMLDDLKFGDVLTKSFKTLRTDSTLSEAKVLMDRVEKCADVFATEDGTPNTMVLGWVTNKIVEEQSKIE